MTRTVLAIPTPQSRERLRKIFLSSPIAVDVDKLVVRIAEVNEAPSSGKTYQGVFVWFGQKTNDNLGYTELVGTLNCPEMTLRHMELTGNSHEGFDADVVFQSPATPPARSNRGFIASVHDTLVAKEPEQPFDFLEVVL